MHTQHIKPQLDSLLPSILIQLLCYINYTAFLACKNLPSVTQPRKQDRQNSSPVPRGSPGVDH